jgi:hypothetical protein
VNAIQLPASQFDQSTFLNRMYEYVNSALAGNDDQGIVVS